MKDELDLEQLDAVGAGELSDRDLEGVVGGKDTVGFVGSPVGVGVGWGGWGGGWGRPWGWGGGWGGWGGGWGGPRGWW